jgi:HD-GYP domain-containing protein (c-di-GMP phosphodiesterase class II)
MPVLHRLQPDQLKLEDALPWDVLDASGMLLLSKGHVVRSEAQLEELLTRGMYVDAAEYRALERVTRTREVGYDPLRLMEAIQARLAWLLEAQPRDGSFTGEIRALAAQARSLAERSPDLAIAAIQLLEQRNYPIAHSLHVAVLADLVACRAGWDAARREMLGCAALTMNVAMVDLQLNLRNQRDALSKAQRAAIDDHPAAAARILMQCGVMDNEWLRAVLEHHETPDGTGYPRRIRNPGEAGLCLRACDIFSAKISPRAYRKAGNATEATRIMFAKLGQNSADPFPAMLVKELGIYPPGTLVKLASDEIGVVFKRGATVRTPLVMALLNAKARPLPEPAQRDTADAAYAIVAVVSLDKSLVAIDFEEIWCGRRRAAVSV